MPMLFGWALLTLMERRFGLRCCLKWPNDIIFEGRKLAGILCRWREGRVFAGIGINCLQRRFPASLADRACSLYQATGERVAPRCLLPRALREVRDALDRPNWREAVSDRLCYRGHTVAVKFASPKRSGSSVRGILKGLAEDGGLLVDTEAGVVAIGAGEAYTVRSE